MLLPASRSYAVCVWVPGGTLGKAGACTDDSRLGGARGAEGTGAMGELWRTNLQGLRSQSRQNGLGTQEKAYFLNFPDKIATNL
jgi:hypothetical protein